MKAVKLTVMYLVLLMTVGGVYVAISNMPITTPGSGAIETPKAPPPRVDVLVAEPSPFVETIRIPGQVEAVNDIDIAAAIPGVIERVDVSEGEFVEEGERLFEIDLRSRRALLEDARAVLQLAQKNLQRYQKLRENNDISQQQYDEAVTAEQQARAQFELRQVDVSLGQVESPASGVMDRVDVEAGEYAREGSVMGRLLTLDPIHVVAGVPEKYADAVAGQETAQVYVESLEQRFTGSVERLAFGADTNTNTFEMTVQLDNPNYQLRPGMIARVELVTKQTDDALLVPLFAPVKGQDGMSLFVEQNGVARLRSVELGAIQKDRLEVAAGLQPGDRVIVTGQQDLVDGQEIEVIRELSIEQMNQGQLPIGDESLPTDQMPIAEKDPAVMP